MHPCQVCRKFSSFHLGLSFHSSGSFSKSKRSIDPIVEEDQAEAEEGNSKKIFMEDDVWG